MAEETTNKEGTDLIDVGDIEPRFDDDLEATPHGAGEERTLPGLARPREMEGPVLASLKERFAALLIDAAFLYVIYWAAMIVYRTVALGSAAGPIPASGMNGLVFHCIFLLIALLWFALPEFAFGKSAGKWFCRLCVRRTDGTQATFVSALIRNLLRPIDIILFPLLIGGAIMEWSGWHQRIGDMIGHTVVIRSLANVPRRYDVSADILASATLRALAFLFDFLLAAAFAASYALLLNPEEPLVSMLLLVLFPLIIAAFFIIPEWIAKTSPGKWLFGLAVCHEDGSAIDISGAVTRAIWRIFDMNPFGYLTCLFSMRRKRPGDTAAGSLVIRIERSWGGFVCFIGMAVLIAVVGYAGIQNRDNFMSGDFEINFLPSIDFSGRGGAADRTMPRGLAIQNFRFAAGEEANARKPSIFQPGESLLMIFDVGGFARKTGKVWLQEDLSVRYPDDSVGLKLENINDFNRELPDDGLIRFENTISLPENTQPGRYTVTITIRDQLARRELKEQRFFYVTPPEGQKPPLPKDGR